MNKHVSSDNTSTTHFGYETVRVEDKAARVAEVFDSVARRYDIMNDVMSLGSHRVIKRYVIATSGIRPGHSVLDLAGGTGDLTKHISQRVGPSGHVVLSDINDQMLTAGRSRLLDDGIVGNVEYVLADGEKLPFDDDRFDSVVIGYGIRNFTDKRQGLKEMHRVLRPGGRVTILDFSTPTTPAVRFVADRYSSLWPVFGKVLVGKSEPYRYLVESIRKHPNQNDMKLLMESAGLKRVRFQNLLGGIAALHTGYKY